MSVSYLTFIGSDPFKKMSATLLVASIAAINLSANANSFIYATDYLEYQLPDEVMDICQQRDNCPEISVEYMHSNHAWMNDIINKRINDIIVDIPSDSNQAVPNDTDSMIKMTLDNFAKSQLQELPADSGLHYSIDVTPRYIGHIGDIELFEINSYLYLGGAHGMPYSEYVMLDAQKHRKINVTDLIADKDMAQYRALVYAAYKQWVADINDDEMDAANYENSWPFIMSDNILLTDKGIDIVYQPYAIAPYAYGMPTLSLSYEQLDGIINPRYIVNNK